MNLRANSVSPNFSQFFFFFSQWFGSGRITIQFTVQELQFKLDRPKIQNWFSSWHVLATLGLTSLDDVAVATDWTPRIDMLESRGDTWHEACARRVHVCWACAGICLRVERRLRNLLARGGAWRRVCSRTNSFSVATDRSANDDANGGSPFPFRRSKAYVLECQCSDGAEACEHGFRNYRRRVEMCGYAGGRFSTIC